MGHTPHDIRCPLRAYVFHAVGWYESFGVDTFTDQLCIYLRYASRPPLPHMLTNDMLELDTRTRLDYREYFEVRSLLPLSKI